MSEYTEPKICLLCNDPTSLCSCKTTITDSNEAIGYLQQREAALVEENKRLRSLVGKLVDSFKDLRAKLTLYSFVNNAPPPTSAHSLNRWLEEMKLVCDREIEKARKEIG